MTKKKTPAVPSSQDQESTQQPTEISIHGVSRRSFLARLSARSIAASAIPLLHTISVAQVETSPAPASAPAGNFPPVPIVLNVNGRDYRLKLEPRVTLLDTLRKRLHLFGTKKGCDHGQCGACTVHVNGRRVNSCLTFAVMHEDGRITTIEGLANNGELHPVQAAFLERDGFQCGIGEIGLTGCASALTAATYHATGVRVRVERERERQVFFESLPKNPDN